MGSQNSTRRLSAEYISSQFGKYQSRLSEVNRNLLRFALRQAAEHMMDETGLHVYLEDEESFSCIPSGCREADLKSWMVVSYDARMKPEMYFDHMSGLRSFKSYVIDGIKSICARLIDYLPEIASRAAARAITFL
ncbi:hypothetical protein DPMN_172667 [Dreissena polymorpha]|uniref:Uncharacterized protein n=1 Tax=Dreissena polymorpha TaxID=45954 RepID=A0A9D4IG99_DREPO|nr:hypothetical protein DPMN_172667 [Dreissena polymorpha]